MPRWLKKKKDKSKEVVDSVTEGLKKLYKLKLLPLEEHALFHQFHSAKIEETDFDGKPQVLLVGQYSTGKTTFIRYLLEQDYPGIRIGPEPTTDRFIVITYNESETTIPGNALAVDASKPFRALGKFGNAFLNRLVASCIDNPLLQSLTFIDTPGILSGEKQRVDRGYDFSAVLTWFAERVDRIILLFDAHKLDISDEFKAVIDLMKPFEDKIRIVLNKADRVNHQQLMSVYGALMWSLGKVLNTPEVARVYVGSFWDEPLYYDTCRSLFEAETRDLFKDLQLLPRTAIVRKINDFIRRARLAIVHSYVVSELREQMPMVGKDSKKKELIEHLDKVFEKVARTKGIPIGDFPEKEKMKHLLQDHDFTKFPKEKAKLVEVVEQMLANDITKLMALVPEEQEYVKDLIETGPIAQPDEFINEGLQSGKDDEGWVVDRAPERQDWDRSFDTLCNSEGKINGSAAKQELIKSRLPTTVLFRIWKLADVDEDGSLDREEWLLANYLIKLKLDGVDLPQEVPAHLIPLSKRGGGGKQRRSR